MAVRVLGRVSRLEILDERRKKMKDAQVSGFDMAGMQNVKSPMPGKVIRVMVKEGDEVKEGQGVVVVEAMKMENELKAPKDGVVSEVLANEGQTVDSGTMLVAISELMLKLFVGGAWRGAGQLRSLWLKPVVERQSWCFSLRHIHSQPAGLANSRDFNGRFFLGRR